MAPYKGCGRRNDRAAKTRTTPKNRCDVMTGTILMPQNFVVFKVGDESEPSDSEFYYPGELSDAEPHVPVL